MVDRTSQLGRDDWSRPHSVVGGNAAGSPLDPVVANRKVWGPGYTFAFAGLPSESLPAERVRVSATDLAGKPYCDHHAAVAYIKPKEKSEAA